MQTRGKVFEDLAQLMTNAMGVAQDARKEFETGLDSWFDRWVAERNLVTREEFEAVRLMAQRAREENESLLARIEQLEVAAARAAQCCPDEPDDPGPKSARIDDIQEELRSAKANEGFNLDASPDPDFPVLVIKITDHFLNQCGGDIYETVRASWRMGQGKVDFLNRNAHLVLAVHDKRCVGVFAVDPGGWALDPELSERGRPRFSFKGREAEESVRNRYFGRPFLNAEGEVDRGQAPVRYFGVPPS